MVHKIIAVKVRTYLFCYFYYDHHLWLLLSCSCYKLLLLLKNMELSFICFVIEELLSRVFKFDRYMITHIIVLFKFDLLHDRAHDRLVAVMNFALKYYRFIFFYASVDYRHYSLFKFLYKSWFFWFSCFFFLRNYVTYYMFFNFISNYAPSWKPYLSNAFLSKLPILGG